MAAKKKNNVDPPDGRVVIGEVLAAAGQRPTSADEVAKKTQYAVRFADRMAEQFAAHLAPQFPDIQASTKRSAGAVRGRKQLDVNFSTPQLGLALGLSLKSVHVRDVGGSERYTHNMKRNEEELRIEATGYHKRQPYAVMIGVLFLPIDSCEDGKKDNPSSFGSWVRHLRPYAGRTKPDDEPDKFEKIYIALYDATTPDLHFFDVSWDPPRNGRPKLLRSYREFLDDMYVEYLKRNGTEFAWADGDEEPLDVVSTMFDVAEED
ncbi:MAG: hypothetical protein M3468_16855 [Acidobacteriota bacterium]|nr:hypothetical protein [Acidobacteriota bacterium]